MAIGRLYLSSKLLEYYPQNTPGLKRQLLLGISIMPYSPTVGKVQDASPHLVLGLGLLTVSQIQERMKNGLYLPETLVRRNFKSFLLCEMDRQTVELHPSLFLVVKHFIMYKTKLLAGVARTELFPFNSGSFYLPM